MKRNVQDISMASAQPNFPLTGGGYYNTSAFLSGPNIERFEATILDNRTSGSPTIALGTLYVEQFLAANTGDANYVPSQIAAQSIPFGSFGILQAVPLPPYGGPSTTAFTPAATGIPLELNIVQKGNASALCTTGLNAIAPGSPLCADGNGNLTAFQPPAAAPTPTLTVNGAAGAGVQAYALIAVSFNGTYSALGTATAATTGNATMTYLNSITITWTPVADAAYYIIVRTVGAATAPTTAGVIGTVPGTAGSFTDIGLAVVPNTSATVFFQRPAAGGTPTVVQVAGATAGTTTWTYKITAIMPNGVWGTEGTAGSVATGTATLSTVNANKLTWTATSGAAMYAIDRTAAGTTPSTTGFIGFAGPAATTGGFIDYGLPATALTAQLTPSPTPQAGTVLAISKGTLVASTATPTLVLVNVGGY